MTKKDILAHIFAKIRVKLNIADIDVCFHEEKSLQFLFLLKNIISAYKGEKPYKCDNCSAAFNQNSSLIVHGRIHAGDSELYM